MSNGLRYETSVFFKPEENLSENFIIKFRWHCFHPSTSKHQSIVCQRRRNIAFSPPLQSRPRKMRRSYEWKFFYDSQERENEKTESYATCVKGTRRKKRQIIIIQHNTNKFSAIKTKRELSRFSEKGRKFSIPKKKESRRRKRQRNFLTFYDIKIKVYGWVESGRRWEKKNTEERKKREEEKKRRRKTSC